MHQYLIVKLTNFNFVIVHYSNTRIGKYPSHCGQPRWFDNQTRNVSQPQHNLVSIRDDIGTYRCRSAQLWHRYHTGKMLLYRHENFPNFCMLLFLTSGFMWSWKTCKSHEFEWLISRTRKVWKMEILQHKNMTFWSNIKCNIPGSILMHTWWGPLHALGWVLNSHEISFNYHGKVMDFKGHKLVWGSLD